MKQFRNNNKNQKTCKTKPFQGHINQFKKEKFILIHLDKFEGFKQALADAHIEYECGDFYNDGIILCKK